MRRRIGTALAVGGALVLLAGACSDDGGEALDEDEYIERACALGDDVQQAVGDIEAPESDDFDQVVESAEEGQDAIDQAIEDLDELEPPSDLEDAHDEIRSFLEEYRDLLGEQVSAAEDEDEGAVEDAADEINELFEDAEFEIDDECSALDDSSDGGDSSDSTDSSDDFSDTSDVGGSADVCAEPTSGELEVGDTRQGAVEEAGDVVAFELSGDGSAVDIAADQTDDEFDPVLTICDSDGTEVDSDDDGGGFPNALVEGFQAEEGESYVIAVSGFFDQSTGEFEVSVS